MIANHHLLWARTRHEKLTNSKIEAYFEVKYGNQIHASLFTQKHPCHDIMKNVAIY